jgi:hypothetical protein
MTPHPGPAFFPDLLLISDVDLLEAAMSFSSIHPRRRLKLVRIGLQRLYMLSKLERGFGKSHVQGRGGLMRGQRGSGPRISSVVEIGAYPFQRGFITHLSVVDLVIPLFESKVED